MIRFDRRFLTGATLAFALLGLSFAACGGSGGGSPTAPPPPAAGGSATISGQVTSVNGVSPEAAAGSRSPSAASAASTSTVITVRIQGTGLGTRTDLEGRFSLGGVPGGDQVMEFEIGAVRAPLTIPAIQVGERIELTVSIEESTVVVESIDRSG